MMSLFLKILGNFIRLIFLDAIWFVHLPFGIMTKFLSLTQFLVDHFPYTIVLYSFSCQYTVFVYNRFIPFSAQPTFAILLHIISFRFNIIGPYGIVFIEEIQFLS